MITDWAGLVVVSVTNVQLLVLVYIAIDLYLVIFLLHFFPDTLSSSLASR